ncbi:UNVERIFIED_CONTAM: hypothetical protein FKN15_017687 [Acipenser sinensis]
MSDQEMIYQYADTEEYIVGQVRTICSIGEASIPDSPELSGVEVAPSSPEVVVLLLPDASGLQLVPGKEVGYH